MKSQLTSLVLALLVLTGCDLENQSDDFELFDLNLFVLCEGNFGHNNSSLWKINLDDSSAVGPIYAGLTGENLGDVGQSLLLAGETLFAVINNSHTVEMLDLSDGVHYSGTIDVSGAGPRYLVTDGDRAYLSCWNLPGIIVFDVSAGFAAVDTIPCPGLPENLLLDGTDLYASITMDANWAAADQVSRFNTQTGTITGQYEVIPGPGALVLQDEYLYAASTYYDQNWLPVTGTSRINLATGEVTTITHTTTLGADIFVLNNHLYRSTATGITRLGDDLAPIQDGLIDGFSNVYSAAGFDDYIFLGITDYVAPDTVIVLESNGTVLQRYATGAIPGAFSVYLDN